MLGARPCRVNHRAGTPPADALGRRSEPSTPRKALQRAHCRPAWRRARAPPPHAGGRFHPATWDRAGRLRGDGCPRTDRGPPLGAPPPRWARRGLPARRPSPREASLLPPGWGPAPHRTGPRAEGVGGPAMRCAATRPHASRRAPATPGASPPLHLGARGPVSSWRPVAACSTRALAMPGFSGRTPAPRQLHLRAAPRDGGYTTARMAFRGGTPAWGAPAAHAGRSRPGPRTSPGARGPHHDTLRRDSALQCA
jgi:hypothetical protein